MRTVTTSVNVYTFAELSEAAQQKAIQGICELLAGPWWDGSDNDDIGNTIVYALAERFNSSEWDTKGEGDFPGIAGVSIEAWSMDRSQILAVAGTLDRQNAPGLPWIDGIKEVQLTAHCGDSTSIELIEREAECTCSDNWLSPHDDGCPSQTPPVIDTTARMALETAVMEALHDAWKAGETEMEYKTGEEWAKQLAEDYEFTDDGTLYP
jgi:hypothetical protein